MLVCAFAGGTYQLQDWAYTSLNAWALNVVGVLLVLGGVLAGLHTLLSKALRPLEQGIEAQMARTRAIVSTAADAIIGMHPHVIQPMVILHPKNNPSKNVPVAFSLGNFISNQRERYKDGGIGVVLHLKVKNNTVSWNSWSYIPFWCRLGGSPRGYYSVPVSDWENHPEKYNMSAEEKLKISTFADDTRKLLLQSQEIKLK